MDFNGTYTFQRGAYDTGYTTVNASAKDDKVTLSATGGASLSGNREDMVKLAHAILNVTGAPVPERADTPDPEWDSTGFDLTGFYAEEEADGSITVFTAEGQQAAVLVPTRGDYSVR